MNVMPVQANQRTNFSGTRNTTIPRYVVEDLTAKGLQLLDQGRNIMELPGEIRVLTQDGSQVLSVYVQKAAQALATV